MNALNFLIAYSVKKSMNLLAVVEAIKNAMFSIIAIVFYLFVSEF